MIRKVLIAFIIACLVSVPIYAFAESSDTDYSYLEDMSVKELKQLRDEINKLLGDDSSGESTSETELPEKDKNGFDLKKYEDHYSLAITAVRDLKKAVKNPSSLEVSAIGYQEGKDSDGNYQQSIYISYSASNAFGAMLDDVYCVDFNKNKTKTSSISWRSISDSLVSSMWETGQYKLDVDFVMANS